MKNRGLILRGPAASRRGLCAVGGPPCVAQPVLLLLSLLIASPLVAQAPYAAWLTVETPHFRVHYPREYAAWALRAAARIEPIRDAVVQEIGFDPPQVTDVLVMNPEAEPNGLTYPLLDTPRIILYTEAPDPDQQIGEFGDWIDLLLTHEMAHLVHLLRPSRNHGQRVLTDAIGFGRITLSAPRWVLEGYATVVEGRLTGTGRPPGTLRAAILRKWAQNGRLPAYAQLNSDHRFMGMSMAYLVGSAFLEWLEERSGPGSLRNLWARLTARQKRSFDSAFEGVFGDTPDRLYGRFVAELTERAVNVDRETAADLREGEVWQQTSRGSGDPAVSPDGGSIAVVERGERGPAKLLIWSTGPATEEEKKYKERIEKILALDPEDVAPVRSRPPRRKPVHTLNMIDGGNIETPRWTADGRSLLFTHRQPDHSGARHRDLFRWTPATGGVDRITHLADVFDADPFPDGRRAIAVRSRYGLTQLVTIDLKTGAVEAVTSPSLDLVYSHPRLSPNGRQIAFALHNLSEWRLVVRDVATGAEKILPTAERANAATPEWSRDAGDLFATLLAGGFAEIHRFSLDGGDAAVTRTSGGAFQPAPSPDGRLFFMSLEPGGFVLRVLDRPHPAPRRSPMARSLVPALPPAAAAPVEIDETPLTRPFPYDFSRQEFGLVLSEVSAPSSKTTEIGVRAGDVVGRTETIAVASLGQAGFARGATLATAWRIFPVELRAQLFRVDERIGREEGMELRGLWHSRFPLWETTLETGAMTGRWRDIAEDFRSQNIGWISGSAAFVTPVNRLSIDGALSGGDRQLAHIGGRSALNLGGVTVEGQLRRDQSRNVQHFTDSILVGGMATTIMPRSLLLSRVLEPALTTATLAGRRYTGAGLSAGSGGLAVFYRRHEIDGTRPGGIGSIDATTTVMRVAGIEYSGQSPPLPILKLPALGVAVGGGRLLDGRARGRTQWWIGIRYEP